MILPLLIKPKILSLRNRWRHRSKLSGNTGQDIIFLIFSIGLMFLIYGGSRWSLAKINSDPNLIFLPPSQPLSLILMFLQFMMFVSSLVAALGSLFLSEDLDLILASPLGALRLAAGKLVYVLYVSAWMPAVFIIPLLLAFGRIYGADPQFYLLSVIILIPYFVISAGLAVSLAVLFTLVMPANRTREIMGLVIIALLGMVYVVLDLIYERWTVQQGAGDLLKMISLLSLPQMSWFPSHWVATCLGELLMPAGRSINAFLAALYSTAVAACSLAFILVDRFHLKAFSRAKNVGIHTRRGARHGWPYPFKLIPGQQYRAMIMREIRTFSRDVTQSIQLLMLFGLCFLYFSNLKSFGAIDSLPEAGRHWWRNFFFICNFAMGAFVVTAFCTRFVYPSISLEGRAWWILQTGPLSVRQLMRIKFVAWFLPVALFSALIFGMGAQSVGSETRIIVLNSVCGVIVAFGIVGIAVGCGAIFSNFSWEHSSELAAGFGSLAFMLFSTFLIGLNMLPTWYLVVAWGERRDPLAGLGWLVPPAFLLCMAIINVVAAKLALRRGLKVLLSHQE